MREMVSQISRSATIMPGQIRRLQWESVKGGVKNQEYIPRTEYPVVPLVRIRQFCAFGRGQTVRNVALGIEVFWVGVPGWIVVHCPSIQNDNGVLGDEVALVCEVFARDVRGAEPDRVVTTFNLYSSHVSSPSLYE